jgi:probable phosphoglycerate mutase
MTDPIRFGNGRVILIRHGETSWSALGKHTGRTDIELTVSGELAAKNVAALLPVQPDLVLCSPLKRAQRTAELAGLVVSRAEPDLIEWDYGSWEGRTTPEIRQALDDPAWLIWDQPIPQGEQLSDVATRVDRVVAGVLQTVESGGTAVLVAHGHVLRILAARWLGQAPICGRYLALDPATISILGFEHEEHVITTWNSPR